MHFEGLQGLLKKKQKQQQPTPNAADAGRPSGNTESGSEGQPQPSPSTNSNATQLQKTSANAIDPYAAALLKAQALREQQQQEQHKASKATDAAPGEGRKRSREASEPEGVEDSQPSTQPVESAAPDASAPTTESDSTPALKASEEVMAERQRAVAALQRCCAQLEQYWASVRSRPPPASPVEAAPHSGLIPPPLPPVLGQYLLRQFVSSERVAPATGEPEMSLLNRELQLLSDLHAAEVEGGDDASLPGSVAAPAASESSAKSNTAVATNPAGIQQHQQQLAETIRVLWYMIALRWQHSLDPQQTLGGSSSSGSRCAPPSAQSPLPPDQRGWSPHVYLFLQNALPADVRLTQGRAVAEEVDRWRASTRTRQFALELLAYLHNDHQQLAAAAQATSPSSDSSQSIVPAELRANLHAMLVQHLQQDRNYLAARQDYVDITMGTANWKLGLFSGGEVHMRRSMERVERNRIAHLLNNEHATHLLQSVRELTTFVEQLKLPATAPFFASPPALRRGG